MATRMSINVVTYIYVFFYDVIENCSTKTYKMYAYTNVCIYTEKELFIAYIVYIIHPNNIYIFLATINYSVP